MRAVAVLALLATGCLSRLDRVGGWGAGGVLAMDLSYRRAVTGAAPVGGVVGGAIRARGFAGPSAPAYAFGVDLALGSSHPRGVAWRVAVSPLGVGGRLGDHGVVGVVGGLGASGISGHVDAALELPVEAFLTLRVGGRSAVSLWVQPAWLLFSGARQDGAPDVGFTDELRAGLTVRAGRAYDQWGVRSGNGYHLGLVAAEEHGARYVGVTIGYDLDVSTK